MLDDALSFVYVLIGSFRSIPVYKGQRQQNSRGYPLATNDPANLWRDRYDRIHHIPYSSNWSLCTPSSSRFQGVRNHFSLLPHVDRQSCHITLHQSADSRTKRG